MPKHVLRERHPKSSCRLPVRRGAGVIIPVEREGRTLFVFTLEKRSYWSRSRGKFCINYTFPGGGSRPEEKRHQTAVRESFEEIGCKVMLEQPQKTLITSRGGRFRVISPKIMPAPIFIYSERHSKLRGRGGGGEIMHHSRVYAGKISEGELKPSSEVPAILLMPKELAVETAAKNMSLKELLEKGAEIIESKPGIPRQAIIAPLGKRNPFFWERHIAK